MTIASLVTSILAFFERLDRAYDHDPIEGYHRRLAAAERKLAEISAAAETPAEPARALERA